VARINTLLHNEPGQPLPPPPQRLEESADLPALAALPEQAVARRPDLAALAARLQSERNQLQLACAQGCPDFEVMGRYDTFWTDPAQRGQVGLYLNLPVYGNRRAAAVREATFRVSKLQAEYDQQLDLVRSEVATAYARATAGRRTLELYIMKILPASQDNVAAAASGYTAGTVDFLRLVQAQRESIELNEKYQQAIVDYHRARAELDRVMGSGL
jgi:cobalt-zinc-cadmium efflux system outer membrane protein